VSNSRSSEKLSSEEVENFLSRYRDPEDARNLLIEMGMIDEHGDLTPPYKKPPEEPEDFVDQWRSKGRSVLFF